MSRRTNPVAEATRRLRAAINTSREHQLEEVLDMPDGSRVVVTVRRDPVSHAITRGVTRLNVPDRGTAAAWQSELDRY